MNLRFHEERRKTFVSQMEDGVALFFARAPKSRNADVEYPFRQDSDFYYLTGLEEPEAVAVIEKSGGESRYILFVRPHDKEAELWMGKRLGVDGALSLGADEAYNVETFWDKLKELLKNREVLYYKAGEDPQRDARVFQTIEELKGEARFGHFGPWRIVDPRKILWEMRLIKTGYEIGLLREAARITSDAFRVVMERTRPGMKEYEIAALLEYEFKRHGCARLGFETIAAAGNNATTLHYMRNDAEIGEHDLVLLDAGCEYGYLTSDVTRTFPASRRFSKAQRAIYELVLEAQKAAIAKVSPSNTYQDVHMEAVRVLTQGLIDLGLLGGTVEEAIETKTYAQFFPHRVGHWLGMDVHDCGPYFEGESSIRLRPGIVMTIEPGIYISREREDVSEEFRGIGVRIEDDCLVTEEGCELLTSPPKEVDELVS